MGCCDDRKKRHCHGLPDKFVDVSCMKTKEWDEVPTIIGLSECGHVVPIDKPIYELSEDDRNKLDAINIDGKGEKALYSDGVYKKTYTKEKTDEIVSGLNESIEANAEAIEANKEAIESNKEAIGANAEAIAENAKGIAENKEAIEVNKEAIEANVEAISKLREDSENAVSDLRDEVADNYLALAGNTEQTPITGDVYISERIVARQTGAEGTQYRVMLDGTEAGTEHFGSTLAHTNFRSSDRPTVNGSEDMAYLSDIGTVVGDVAQLQEDVTELEERMDQAEEDIQTNAQSIEDLGASTEASFISIDASLDDLDSRVTVNEVNISQNANDIDQLRDDLANQEKFRGYFETTVEVTTIPNPTNGDYAWNAESGTVWLYNGETWYDSAIKIPDQTVEAYEAVPRMDGEGDAGATNRYARGDHQHPSDDSKADVSDLENYLALEGNTQSTRMSGDIWMSTGKSVRLSNSGKSYLAQDADNNTTQLHGNGVGGVDIVAPNGTVKANGDRVITETEYNESLTDINELQLEVAENASSISGLDERLGLAETGVQTNETAISELKTATEASFETVNDSLGSLDSRMTASESHIAQNTSDIDQLREDLSNQEKFRGYFETTAEVTTIPNPTNGDYAWNAESGTVWLYNGATWYDSTINIPDQTVEPYEVAPRMDGEGDAGSTNRYARGDHQHPSDDSKANVSDLESYLALEGNSQATRITGDVWMSTGKSVKLSNSGNSYLVQDSDSNTTQLHGNGVGGVDIVAPNGAVKANGDRVITETEYNDSLADISQLQTDVEGNASSISGLDGRLTQAEAGVESNKTAISELQEATEVDVSGLKAGIEKNAESISGLDERVTQAEGEIKVNEAAISALKASTESDFEKVNESLDGLDGRVTINESNIAQNTSDIDQLREDLTNQEKFRGYFETTAEVTTIPTPTNGDYAWNAESGTVWLYNGETWYDSTINIPDQTVEPYEVAPRMDGEGDAGSTNRYARGDHQHPSDDSKANVSDLESYLALEGNSQATRITGDIWMSTGKSVKLSNSGNSYLVQDSDSNTTQLHGNGVGGVDIVAPNGVVKANGDRIITETEYNDSLADISQLQADVEGNASSISGLDGRLTQAEAGVESNKTAISELQAATETDVNGLKADIEENATAISGLDDRLVLAEAGIQTNETAISDLQSATEAGFETVNESFDRVDGRISENSRDIATNSSEIEALREDLASRELFRGYYETIAEVTIIKEPVAGNYAWCAESGTVWMYNGTTWFDSTTPIPDQTVEAYDAAPRMDGEGDAGVTNRYARGDHQHPSDDSKANVSDLDAYLALDGNTQATRMSGDIWMATGQKVRLNNSGNSYVGQGDNNNTEIVSAGTGGIDLNATNGAVKVNGEEVVTYDSNGNIVAHNNIILGNDKKILGTGADGVQHNLIEKNRLGVIDAGSKDVPFNISASARPTVQVKGESGVESHEVAFLGDINGAQADLQDQVSANASDIASLKNSVSANSSDIDELKSEVDEHGADISELETKVQSHASDIDGLKSTVAQNVVDVQANKDAISINTSDIESIQAELASQEHFRGYYASTAEVTTISDPKVGNYAYNAESGTKWAYNGETWYDTTNIIPDQTVEAYDGLPLVDDVANAGDINQYARGDHRHPTDLTRASAVDLAATNLYLSELESSVSGYQSSNDANISDIKSRVSVTESNVSSITGRVSANETNIHTLTGEVAANTSGVSSLTGRVLANEGKIVDLIGGVSVNAADISNLKNRVDGNDSDISGLQSQSSQLSNDFNLLSRDFTDLEVKVDHNKSDIESLQSLVTNQEHFRGYYLTTVEITLLPATEGDYAWNAETGTVWVYNGTVLSWTDSREPLPVQAVFGCDVLPLMDGEANAGESGSYSRGDHRHPTDTSRAAVTDIPTHVSQLVNDAEYVTSSELSDELDNYLPLEGGTITGDLRVDGQFNYPAVLLTNSDDIDTLFTNGRYYWANSDEPTGTLPDTYVVGASSALVVYKISNTGAFQMLITGSYIYTRTISNAMPTNGWERVARNSELSSYLPLTGGTITGDLNVEGKFTQVSKKLLSTDNIDELCTQGVYYITGNTTLPEGTFPDNYTNTLAGLFYVDQTNQQGAYRQTLYNGTRLFSRTISTEISAWNEFARASDLSSYLPLTGGKITGDLTVNGRLFFKSSNITGISPVGDRNIDNLITEGFYYGVGGATVEGTFPPNTDSTDLFYSWGLEVRRIGGSIYLQSMFGYTNSMNRDIVEATRIINTSNNTISQWTLKNLTRDYLPLSGGTITGDLTVDGKFNYPSISMSPTDNIDDSRINPGNYYWIAANKPEGTFPADYSDSNSGSLTVVKLSQTAIYQLLYNNSNLYYRALTPESTNFNNWRKSITSVEIGSYLPLSGGTMSGNLDMASGTDINLRSANTKLNVYATSSADMHVGYAANNGMEIVSGSSGGLTLETNHATSGSAHIKLVTDTGKALYNGKEIAVKEDIPEIALSDQVLTIDDSGLKANLSVEVNGNIIKILGKEDSSGEKVVIKEINILQSQVIQNVELRDNILYVTFIIADESEEGGVKYETVEIDLKKYIDVYYSGEYVTVGNDNKINLNYDEVHDELVNDGFLRKSNVINNLTSTNADLPLSANQGKVLNEKFGNYLPLSGGDMTGHTNLNGYKIGFGNSITNSNIGLEDNAIALNSTNTYGLRLSATNNADTADISLITNGGIATYNSSEIATVDDLENYLPLEGGTVTGDLKVDGQLFNEGTRLRQETDIDTLLTPGTYWILAADTLYPSGNFPSSYSTSTASCLQVYRGNNIGGAFQVLINGSREYRRFISGEGTVGNWTTSVNKVDLDSYLPLKGGTVTGDLTMSGTTTSINLNNQASKLNIYNSSDKEMYLGYETDAGVLLHSDSAYGITLRTNHDDIRLETSGSSIATYNGKEIATVDDLENYLPLEGGTVTGDLNVNGKFNYPSTRLTSVDNIDTLTTPGRYYFNPHADVSGAFPDDYNPTKAVVLIVDTTNTALTVYQVMYNNRNTYIRTVSTGGVITEWVKNVITSDLSSYLPLTGGIITGNLKINGLADYNGSEIATIDQLTDAILSYESTITNTNTFTVAGIKEVLMLTFERVVLYNDEFTLSNGVITITANDLDFTGTNRVKLIYK